MVVYLQCPACGGVFIVQRTDEYLAGQAIVPSKLMHRDGRPVSAGELVRCDDCGARGTLGYPFRYDRQRRTADALPPPPATAGKAA